MEIKIRRIALLLSDAFLVNLAVFVALLLRFDGDVIPLQYIQAFRDLSPIFTLLFIASFIIMRLYNRVWEYASIEELIAIVKSTTFGLVAFVMVLYIFQLNTLPRSVYFISWVMINMLIGASRVWWRVFRVYFTKKSAEGLKRVLVIGAGNAGAILVKEIQSNPQIKLQVVGIVDDDPNKKEQILHDVPILGDRKSIPKLVEDMEIDELIIAMPSVSGAAIREIVDFCKKTPAKLKIIPGIYQSSDHNVLNSIRDVRMEDLLKRVPSKINLDEIAGYISGKIVLVTGAGGSIGSELCRQIIKFSPRKLVILDNSENNLFEIEIELKAFKTPVHIWTELVDVRNRERIEDVFKLHRPNVVFHAAAYKHVPMMERHPDHALDNNVIGTRNTAKMSDKYGVETFIQISTDKAVNPTSVMGASKRIAELVIKDINRNSSTKFAAVRFGNVLGSRGSVVPMFIKQIENGGPVTVTHPEMQRYFMTIPEAVELVIEAGSLAQGGEIFVLDMGEMIKIDDLARELIKLSGLEPGKDIQITYTGMRPGEKLYEEIFTNREEMDSTLHERIFISRKELDNRYIDFSKTMGFMLKGSIKSKSEVLRIIKELVPEFRGLQEISDEMNNTSQSKKHLLERIK